MAFMEKPPAGKVLLDDTVPLTAVIEASQSLHSHTEYIIRVQRGISMENSWQIVRRYSDFDLLNSSLQISALSLPLPPKKLIGNMDREFIAERQKGLQNYLNVITTNHILSNCELVKKFLDPNNYSVNYTEIALQHVSMFFRSEPKWEVVEPLKDIGWRIRKRYFLMKSKNQPKERLMLSWADFGPDKYLSDKDFQCAVKLLPSCSHPYIYKVTFATANESSALVIRPFNEKGTLKDLIYKAKPKDPFLKKYCNPKKIQGLELQQIKTFGRQILEVLKFLHEKGFPYGHLHSSNVMLDGDTCRLLDLENSLLGLPSFYRSYFTQFRKINTLEGVDVHCFGHLLYEMTYGRPPDSIPVDGFPPAPSASVVAVLESLLSCEALKNGMPAVSKILQMSLFSDILLTNSEKPQFKIPTKLKEALKTAKECIEKRLTEEQKLIHQHRRLTRAQSHHGSEEEKKKRKILARKKSKLTAVESGEEHLAKYSNSNNSAGSGASSPLTSPSSPTPPSTAGVSTIPPPPPPPAAPPLPPQMDGAVHPDPSPADSASREALLSSIQNFQKGALKKADTCDYSVPRIS
ncbi:PX domain-containing protein kinase-like protein isoform X1 [Malaclemys terrapin pileata]|uniref:PX domain-containing protein kinase-like protein isoform X1 n=2 Tax=Malaclemys terrapin pileata TaxID=2991368 RepID=UPI0023A7EAE7|nr:PX domain-containing protein kinase-like protein isoform X1 [Malaclemys terrapin pileata]